MMNAIIALRCLGYSADDPQLIRALDEFEKLASKKEHLPHAALHLTGVGHCVCHVRSGRKRSARQRSRMVKSADWMLQKQVRKAGDWTVKNKQGQPGGWYFEFNNEFYPDVDDTAWCVSV